jgi:hypothetical protein
VGLRLGELGPVLPRGPVLHVDGELMRTRHMSARCFHGLIEVFGPQCVQHRGLAAVCKVLMR